MLSRISQILIFQTTGHPFKRNKTLKCQKDSWGDLTFHGMFAFQHLQDSLRCCRMVLALFCLIPSGIMSKMSCITAARNSRSKWDSTRCLVTVFATPFEWRPAEEIKAKPPLLLKLLRFPSENNWLCQRITQVKYVCSDLQTVWPADFRATAPTGGWCPSWRTATPSNQGPRSHNLDPCPQDPENTDKIKT